MTFNNLQKDKSETQNYDDEDTKIDDITAAMFSQLINMGFPDDLSMNAAVKHPGDLNEALDFIYNHSNPSDKADVAVK